jgi:hypothetical protein
MYHGLLLGLCTTYLLKCYDILEECSSCTFTVAELVEVVQGSCGGKEIGIGLSWPVVVTSSRTVLFCASVMGDVKFKWTLTVVRHVVW